MTRSDLVAQLAERFAQLTQRDTFLKLGFGRGLDGLRRALPRLAKLVGWGLLLFAAGAGLLRLRAALWRRGDGFERAEAELARAGIARASWQTPREFARGAVASRPGLAPLAELAESHYRRRFGRVPDDATSLARERALLQAIRRELLTSRA